MSNKTRPFTQAVKYQPLPPTTSNPQLPHSQENAYFYKVIDAADQTCSNAVVNQSLAVTCVRATRRQRAKFRFKPISIPPLSPPPWRSSDRALHPAVFTSKASPPHPPFLLPSSPTLNQTPTPQPSAPTLIIIQKRSKYQPPSPRRQIYYDQKNPAVIPTARSRLREQIRRRRKWHPSISFRSKRVNRRGDRCVFLTGIHHPRPPHSHPNRRTLLTSPPAFLLHLSYITPLTCSTASPTKHHFITSVLAVF